MTRYDAQATGTTGVPRLADADAQRLVDADSYAANGYPHEIWTQLRRERPVAWVEILAGLVLLPRYRLRRSLLIAWCPFASLRRWRVLRCSLLNCRYELASLPRWRVERVLLLARSPFSALRRR